jgi:hypothetical protein
LRNGKSPDVPGEVDIVPAGGDVSTFLDVAVKRAFGWEIAARWEKS